MKKIIFLLCFVACGYLLTYANTYVNGVNQINDLLYKIEQGTGDEPPARVATTDEGPWRDLEAYGITITLGDDKFIPFYMTDESSPNWLGFTAIDFADQGYKQQEGTVISLVQPSFDQWFYDGVLPDPWKDPWQNDWNPTTELTNWKDYWDRNDLSYLELIDFSGNDFSNLVINGSLDENQDTKMPLQTLILSNNPNLTSLSVINCYSLELLDITKTGLSADAIAQIKEDVLAASPDCVILADDAPEAINVVNVAAPAVYIQGDILYIKDKAPGEVATVFDLSGQTLMTSADNAINLGSLGNGVYLVKVNGKITKVLKK